MSQSDLANLWARVQRDAVVVFDRERRGELADYVISHLSDREQSKLANLRIAQFQYQPAAYRMWMEH